MNQSHVPGRRFREEWLPGIHFFPVLLSLSFGPSVQTYAPDILNGDPIVTLNGSVRCHRLILPPLLEFLSVRP